MKKIISWLLIAATVLSLCGCGAAEAPAATEAPAETTAPETQPVAEETEAPLLAGSLYLKASSVSFSLVGETDDIYLGLIPREEVTWESDDPSIVSVENGVLTANAVGETTIRATYGDHTAECAVSCLAQTQQELEALPAEILSAPKRLPPKVDLEQPCTYFDNAAMVGDSITYHLWQSEVKNNYLGNVLFLTRNGVSINSLVRRFKNIYFEGQDMYLEDIVAKCGAQRLYIMLRDFLVTASLSCLPGLPGEPTPDGLNAFIADFNIQLRQMCADRGFGFLDLSYYVEDHLGRIPAIYDKDAYHMNDEGSLVWMQVMRYYAQYEREGGILS